MQIFQQRRNFQIVNNSTLRNDSTNEINHGNRCEGSHKYISIARKKIQLEKRKMIKIIRTNCLDGDNVNLKQNFNGTPIHKSHFSQSKRLISNKP